MKPLNHIICEKRTYHREFASHHHEFGQFLFPLQGSLDIKTKWQEINLNSEHCFYLPPKLEHDYRSMDRNEFLILDIPLLYLPEHTENMHLQLDNQWSAIRYLLLEEAKGQDSPSSLANLARYVVSKLQTSNPASIDYIHNHFKEPITLDTLAKIEHYHPVYYSSWFKKRTGKSVKNYVTELRLNEAKSLLVSTSWSMSRISEEVGFENSSSFTRWFRNSEGVAPQKYRILNNG